MPNSADLAVPSRQLRATLSKMAFALSWVDESIVWTDGDGRIQWCNAAFEQLVSQTAAALAEQKLTQLLPLTLKGEPVPLSHHPASWGLANKQRYEGQYGFRRHDRSFALAITAAPLPGSETDLSVDNGVMLVIRNVTAPLQPRSPQSINSKPEEADLQQTEAALRESEQRFRTVFDTTAVGMTVTSPDGVLLQVNAACCQMLGYTQTELLAKTCQQLIHPDDLVSGQAQLQQLLSRSLVAYHLERRYFHKQGHLVWGLLSVSAVHDGQQNALCMVYQIQDITDRKQAELALQILNKELEQRVQQRTAQLEEANRQLQAAIARHEQTEAALRKSEERFHTIFDNAPIAISLADIHTYQIVEVNQAHHALFGYSKDDLATMTYLDITHPDDINENLEQIKQLLDGIISRFRIEKRFVKKNGDWIWATLTVTLIRDPNGRTYSLGMIEDITDRKRTEESLRLTQFSIDRAVDPIWWVEPNGSIYYVNDAACRDLGYPREAIIGRRVSDLNPDLPITAWEDHWQAIKAKGSATFEARVQAKDGTIFLTEVTANYIKLSHKEYHCSFVRNITDRKQAEDQLKASLKEKEILLKEVHHRVKNNLQMISSLLNLQANTIRDPKILAPFRESQNRIKAMVLLHEKLYQSESLVKINFHSYVHSLVANLLRSYSSNPAKINLKLEISEVELSVDAVIPCGLIINELVTNALKYAFPGDRAGEIQVCFSLLTNDQCLLVVADDGVGIPESIIWSYSNDLPNLNSLGLQLVHAFLHQLRGTLELKHTNGSRFELSFPNPV